MKAILLRDEAQGYLEASHLTRAIDVELAQAAWVRLNLSEKTLISWSLLISKTLAFFEICAHPQQRLTQDALISLAQFSTPFSAC